jgi:hypothetical protein
MPGGRKSAQPTAKSEQARLIYGSYGQSAAKGSVHWDPKSELLTAAIVQLIKDGCGVMFSSAGGGRMIGATIYEGDTKHPRKWIYDDEELEEWCLMVIAAGRPDEGGKGE